MPSVVCVGGQWGEEAKGKVFSQLSASSDVVVRFEGSHLGSQIVSLANIAVRLQLIPSGILNAQAKSFLGNGVLIDLEVLAQELDMLEAHDISLAPERLSISPDANLILPFHKRLEAVRPGQLRLNGRPYNTRGAIVAAEDRAGNLGLRMGDLLEPTRLADKLRDAVLRGNALLAALGGEVLSGEDIQSMIKRHTVLGERIAPYIKAFDTELRSSLLEQRRVFFEGSGGTFRDQDFDALDDIDMWSHKAGLAAGVAGVGPSQIDHVLMVAKAYTTRTGRGAMPGELTGDVAKQIQEQGDEIAQATGGFRRITWLDTVQLKKAAMIHGATCIALTKLDVLSGLDHIGLIRDYRNTDFPRRADFLADVEPDITFFDGFDVKDGQLMEDEAQWPNGLKDLIAAVETDVGLPVVFMSVAQKERAFVIRGEIGTQLFG